MMEVRTIYHQFSFTTMCFFQIRVFDTVIMVDLQKDMKKVEAFWWNIEKQEKTPINFVKGG